MKSERQTKEETAKTGVVIPGYRSTCPLHMVAAGDNIIQHYQHAYDESGRVKVIKADKEDSQEYINSFADTCGLKNVLRNILKQGNEEALAAMSYTDEDAYDASGLSEIHGINEAELIRASSDANFKAQLAAFNKALGTSLTPDQFAKILSEGSIESFIQESIKVKETPVIKEGEDK